MIPDPDVQSEFRSCLSRRTHPPGRTCGNDPCQLTEKRLLMTYNQGGKLIDRTKTDPDWWKTALAPFQRVYSVGRTPKNAIRALGKQVGWGKLANYREMPVERPGEWYYRFVAGAGGTSMTKPVAGLCRVA